MSLFHWTNPARAKRQKASSPHRHWNRMSGRSSARSPLPYRQALTLFYAEEKSYEEIARILDMPIGTVKTHIHRGRKLLASLYGEARSK